MNKYLSLAITLFLLPFLGNAQGYDEESIALGNFLVRMYENNPFEGVRIVSDYNDNYLLSVVLVKDKGENTATDRIAQVKSNRQVSQFMNGIVNTDSKTIIRTSDKEGKTYEEITEMIHEQAVGLAHGMEVLRVLNRPGNYKCYMFYSKIGETIKSEKK